MLYSKSLYSEVNVVRALGMESVLTFAITLKKRSLCDLTDPAAHELTRTVDTPRLTLNVRAGYSVTARFRR